LKIPLKTAVGTSSVFVLMMRKCTRGINQQQATEETRREFNELRMTFWRIIDIENRHVLSIVIQGSFKK